MVKWYKVKALIETEYMVEVLDSQPTKDVEKIMKECIKKNFFLNRIDPVPVTKVEEELLAILVLETVDNIIHIPSN